jgi:hypothetical protein
MLDTVDQDENSVETHREEDEKAPMRMTILKSNND